MSLYNALFGVNHLAEALLKILNVNQSPGGAGIERITSGFLIAFRSIRTISEIGTMTSILRTLILHLVYPSNSWI
jgi:hypothetical protein